MSLWQRWALAFLFLAVRLGCGGRPGAAQPRRPRRRRRQPRRSRTPAGGPTSAGATAPTARPRPPIRRWSRANRPGRNGTSPISSRCRPACASRWRSRPGQPTDRPGGFGTFDRIPSVEFVRLSLAVKTAWKPAIDRVVTYEITAPMIADVGTVGPQIDVPADRYLPGGGSQFQMMVPPPNGCSICASSRFGRSSDARSGLGLQGGVAPGRRGAAAPLRSGGAPAGAIAPPPGYRLSHLVETPDRLLVVGQGESAVDGWHDWHFAIDAGTRR